MLILFHILQEEYSDGGIVVEDCLKLMLNLLRNNSSNQTFFREGSYIQRISFFFDLNLDQEELEVGWAAQKVSNMLYMLSVVRTLVSPSNPTQVLKNQLTRTVILTNFLRNPENYDTVHLTRLFSVYCALKKNSTLFNGSEKKTSEI